ncbi:MAG: hypothetical protein A2252_11220 [Elusimicrobia bacterium RIFOXYA2_FULL_39_19]|nr:MAG: hypothetical protein A2252_11220 [Elusimicrobia bacterium RIFOXYA2_FULL_39_19]
MNTILKYLLSPIAGFIIFLTFFYGIYLLAGLVKAKGRDFKGKLKAYACGEDINSIKIQVGYEFFFLFAIFFTIMHVTVLVIATLPSGPIIYFGIFYLVMIFVSVLALLLRERESK